MKAIKYCILILFILSSLVFAGDDEITIVVGQPTTVSSCADSSCSGFLVCQNFEGTGYDNSESWSEEVYGTVDEDDTTATVLRGSQQLKVVGNGSTSSEAIVNFTASGELWVHFRFKPADATPAVGSILFGLYDSTDTIIAYIQMRTNSYLRVYHGTSYLQSSAEVFADNTEIHIWFHYIKGSGANGVYQVYWGNSETIPETPQLDGSNGAGTADIDDLRLREYNGNEYFFDQVLVKTTAIGSICE